MKIVSVLRTGPEYMGEHAQLLHAQLPADAVCLTDLPGIEGVNTVPLQHRDFSGWWAKMELFDPDGPLGQHDLFYLDIDTLVVGDIQPLISAARQSREMVMLSDFFFPDHPASGVMYIPWRIKRRVWEAWIANPWWQMVKHRPKGCIGDQGFIASNVQRILRWDQLCPGAIVSYKKHVAAPDWSGYTRGQSAGDGSIPNEAAIVCFHGQPRPWELEHRICKSSSSPTTQDRSGLSDYSARSQGQQPFSTVPAKVRSKGTARRSKSRSK